MKILKWIWLKIAILVVVVALLIKYNIVSKDTVLFWTNKTIDWAWDYIAKNGDNIKKWIKDWFEKAVDETWKIIDNPKETLDNLNTTLSTISSNSLWETNIKSFNRAKKVLERNVYNGKHKTFYCGCDLLQRKWKREEKQLNGNILFQLKNLERISNLGHNEMRVVLIKNEWNLNEESVLKK